MKIACLTFGRLLPFVLFVGCVAPAWSQSSSSGAVSGLVTDPQNAAIPAVDVTLTNSATNTVLKGSTNDSGRYIFSNVSSGDL